MNTEPYKMRYSERVQNLRPSCVREMMKQVGNTNVISFAAGLPNPALFPVAELSFAAAAVFSADAVNALQYSSTEGFYPLRDYIARQILGPKGIKADPEDIIITNGSQQALDLIAKVFLDPGDRVVLERPAYMAAIQAFDLAQATYFSIPLNERGIDLGMLKYVFSKHPVKLTYLVSSFQNPTGLTYSLRNRRAVAKLIDQYDITLIEDTPYSELRYDGREMPLISSLCQRQNVIIGSFSKVLSPGMRMGWIYADPDTIQKLVIAKQASDLCSNFFSQCILMQYLEKNDLSMHVRTLKRDYRKKRDWMLEMLAKYMPDNCFWTKPKGGMFIWVTLPETVSANELLVKTMTKGLLFAPGSSFYAENPVHNTLRLNFTHSSYDHMEKGIKILADEVSFLS